MEVMILSYLIVLIAPMTIVSLGFGYAQTNVTNASSKSIQNISGVNVTRTDLMINPNFSFFNDTSGLPSYWSDSIKSCGTRFSCTIKFTDGWNDYVSFSLSTTNNTNNTWSAIQGKEIDVKSAQKYQLITHMKLNKWATQSHIVLEGFNETSNNWYQLIQCPYGINGPLEWKEFNCTATIPKKVTEIRVVLNAGWSSGVKKEATTWFDAINLLTNMPLSKGILK